MTIHTITGFETVSAEKAERADFVVCARKGTSTPFRDFEESHCHCCPALIIHRRDIPRKPLTICVPCWFERETGGRP